MDMRGRQKAPAPHSPALVLEAAPLVNAPARQQLDHALAIQCLGAAHVLGFPLHGLDSISVSRGQPGAAQEHLCSPVCIMYLSS